MTWQEFRMKRTNGASPLLWMIKQDGERYYTQSGQLAGKMQKFSDVPGDKGKPDSKAYVNAIDNCAWHILREIRKKLEKGYIEYIDGKPTEEQVTELDFDKCLPKNFCGYKPQTDIKVAALAKLHKAGNARYSLKKDGMCHLAVHHSFGWEIYSRRMDLTTERFPNHIEELKKSKFPVGSIIVGEMYCEDEYGKDNFKNISRICRSLPEETRKLVSDKEVPEPKYMIYDVLFFGKESLENKMYKERMILWQECSKGLNLVHPVSYIDVTPDNWEKIAKEKGWEGFVVVDITAKPGDKFFSFNGEPKRPRGSHKLKTTFQSDVVVFAVKKGSGKRLDGIGALFVKQRHPETGEWINCGAVGTGLKEADLEEWARICQEQKFSLLEKDKEADKIDLDSPGPVIMIEHKGRYATQKFRHAAYQHIREDKTPKECYIEILAAED